MNKQSANLIQSMTGFAQCSKTLDSGDLSWRITCVNQRYLDCKVNLPTSFAEHEYHFLQRIKKTISRGKLEAKLYFHPKASADTQQVDEAALQQLLSAAKHINQYAATHALHPAPLSSADMLAWPGVLTRHTVDTETLLANATALLDDTLAELIGMRSDEGSALIAHIEDKLTAITLLCEQATQRRQAANKLLTEKLHHKVNTLISDADTQRFEQEIVYHLNRLDVTEEIERLKAHSQHCRQIINEGGQVGRKLDFLMQEFNREANTLASKANDAALSNIAIDMKVLIEQMREQVQNLV